MGNKDLDKEFWRFVDIANNMPPQTADNMLIAYAYFKQGTEGDNENERPRESSNIIQTFKHDAWQRLQGMPRGEAKQKYINTIKEFQLQAQEESEKIAEAEVKKKG